jgi:hypothetical protein
MLSIITRVYSVIWPKESDPLFDHPYNADPGVRQMAIQGGSYVAQNEYSARKTSLGGLYLQRQIEPSATTQGQFSSGDDTCVPAAVRVGWPGDEARESVPLREGHVSG